MKVTEESTVMQPLPDQHIVAYLLKESSVKLAEICCYKTTGKATSRCIYQLGKQQATSNFLRGPREIRQIVYLEEVFHYGSDPRIYYKDRLLLTTRVPECGVEYFHRSPANRKRNPVTVGIVTALPCTGGL
jgi:hypothetical protein